MTICAISDDFLGWNKTDPHVFGLDHCRDEEDLEKCVKRLTFTLGDLLKNTSTLKISKGKSAAKDQKFFNNSAWTSKMTETVYGMCHTFTQDKPLCKGTYLHFILNYNITFVFVHDPKFFVFKDINVFVPFLKLENVFRREFNLIATTKKRTEPQSSSATQMKTTTSGIASGKKLWKVKVVKLLGI